MKLTRYFLEKLEPSIHKFYKDWFLRIVLVLITMKILTQSMIFTKLLFGLVGMVSIYLFALAYCLAKEKDILIKRIHKRGKFN